MTVLCCRFASSRHINDISRVAADSGCGIAVKLSASTVLPLSDDRSGFLSAAAWIDTPFV